MAPLDQFQSAIKMFNNGGATIYPVSAVDIQKATDVLDGGAMDVPANYAIQASVSH